MTIRKIAGQTRRLAVSATTTQAGIFKVARQQSSLISGAQNLTDILIDKIANRTVNPINHILYDPEGFGLRKLFDYLLGQEQLKFFITKSVAPDSLSLTESISLFRAKGRLQQDLATILDGTPSFIIQARRSFADSFTPTDRPYFLYAPAALRSTATLTDTRPNFFISKTLKDTTTMVDLADIGDALDFAILLTLANSTSILDNLRAAANYSRSSKDGISSQVIPTDVKAIAAGLSKADSVLLTDVLSSLIQRLLTKNLSDTQSIVDTKALLIGLLKTDISTPTDRIYNNVTKLLGDTQDQQERIYNTLSKLRTDSFTNTDLKAFDFGKSRTDSITEADVKAFIVGKLLADTPTPADRPYLTAGKLLTDLFQPIEVATRGAGKGLRDSFSYADTKVFDVVKSRTDTTAPTDRGLVTVGKLPVDTISITDLKAIFRFTKLLSDSVSLREETTTISDGISSGVYINRFDAFGFTDTLSRTVHFVRDGRYEEFKNFLNISTDSTYSPFPARNFTKVAKTAASYSVPLTRSNYILFSEQFDNAYWFKYNTDVSAGVANPPIGNAKLLAKYTADQQYEIFVNQPTNPYGKAWYQLVPLKGYAISNADLIIGQVTATNKYVQSAALTELKVLGLSYGFSVFVKAAGETQVRLGLEVIGTPTFADFDLSLNRVITSSGVDASIQWVGADWYLCRIAGRIVNNFNPLATITLLRAGSPGFTGDGVSGIYVWGAQVETGDVLQEKAALTYVPTAGYRAYAHGYRVTTEDIERVWAGTFNRLGTTRLSGDPYENFKYLLSLTAYQSVATTLSGNSTVARGPSTIFVGQQYGGARFSYDPLENVAFDVSLSAKQATVNTLSGNTVGAQGPDTIWIGQQYGNIRFSQDPLERIAFDLTNLKTDTQLISTDSAYSPFPAKNVSLSAKQGAVKTLSGNTIGAQGPDTIWIGQQYGGTRFSGDLLENIRYTITKPQTESLTIGSGIDQRSTTLENIKFTMGLLKSDTQLMSTDSAYSPFPAKDLTYKARTPSTYTVSYYNNPVNFIGTLTSVTVAANTGSDYVFMGDAGIDGNGFQMVILLVRNPIDTVTIGTDPGTRLYGNNLETTKFTITKAFYDPVTMEDLTGIFDGLNYNTVLTKRETTTSTDSNAKDFYKIAKQAATVTLSGVTITANTSGDRVFLGQQYGGTRFSGDLLENTRFTFTPGTKTESLLIGSGIDQRSTNEENIRYVASKSIKQGLGTLIQLGNLFTYSEDFSNVNWAKSGAMSITADQAIAPNGTLTADLASASGLFPNLRQVLSVGQNQRYTFSIYVKYINQSKFNMVQEGWGGAYYCNFDILAQTTSPGADVVATLKSVGNGWYRASISYTVQAGQNTLTPQFRIGGYDGNNYAGSQMYIWGAQLEAASAPSDYTPTTASQIIKLTNNSADTDRILIGSLSQRFNSIRASGDEFENLSYNISLDAKASTSSTFSSVTTNARDRDRIFIGAPIVSNVVAPRIDRLEPLRFDIGKNFYDPVTMLDLTGIFDGLNYNTAMTKAETLVLGSGLVQRQSALENLSYVLVRPISESVSIVDNLTEAILILSRLVQDIVTPLDSILVSRFFTLDAEYNRVHASLEQNYYTAITYDQSGGFVTVASPAASSGTNRIATSVDGRSWRYIRAPINGNWSDVVWGAGNYIAVAYSTSIAAIAAPSSSLDWNNTSSWTASTLPFSADGWRLATNGSTVLALPQYATTVTSVIAITTNGSTWTTADVTVAQNYSTGSYANGAWILFSPNTSTAVRSGANVYAWTSLDLGIAANWLNSASNGTGIVTTAANTSTTIVTTDNNTWTTANLPYSGNWSGLVYGNGTYMATAEQTSGAVVSIDGTSWASYDFSTSNAISGVSGLDIAWGAGRWITVSGPTARGLDTTFWANQNYETLWANQVNLFNTNWYKLAASNETYAARVFARSALIIPTITNPLYDWVATGEYSGVRTQRSESNLEATWFTIAPTKRDSVTADLERTTFDFVNIKRDTSTLIDVSAYSPFPARDVFKIAKQAATLSVSGVTVTAADTDTAFVGFRYAGQLKFGTDPYETTRITTGKNIFDYLLLGSGVDQRSTTAENIAFNIVSTKRDTSILIDASTYSPYPARYVSLTAKSGVNRTFSGNSISAAGILDPVFIGQQYTGAYRYGDPLEKAQLLVGKNFNYDSIVSGSGLDQRQTTSENIRYTAVKFAKDYDGTTSNVILGSGLGQRNTDLEDVAFVFNLRASIGINEVKTVLVSGGALNATFITSNRGSYSSDLVLIGDNIDALFAAGKLLSDSIIIGNSSVTRLYGNNTETTKFTITKQFDETWPDAGQGINLGPNMQDLTGIFDGLNYSTVMIKRDTQTMSDVSTFSPYPVRDFVKVAKQATALSFSGITVSASTSGSRVYVGQIYGGTRFGRDPLENVAFVFTPGNKTETIVAGSGLDQRSTTSENIRFTIAQLDRDAIITGGDQVAGSVRLSNTSLENISYNFNLRASIGTSEVKTVLTSGGTPSAVFVTSNRGSYSSDLVLIGDNTDAVITATKAFTESIILGSQIDQRNTQLENVRFTITKLARDFDTTTSFVVLGSGIDQRNTALEDIYFTITKTLKEFNGVSSQLVTTTDTSTYSPYPVRDVVKVAKQATALSFSGITVSASTSGSRVYAGQIYGAGRFSGDPLENFKYTFTPGTKTETITAGSGLDQRSTTSENVRFTIAQLDRETLTVTETNTKYIALTAKIGINEVKTVLTNGGSLNATFVTSNRGSASSDLVLIGDNTDALFASTKGLAETLTIGSGLDQRQTLLEPITFVISKRFDETYPNFGQGTNAGPNMLDLTGIFDGLNYSTVMIRRDTATTTDTTYPAKDFVKVAKQAANITFSGTTVTANTSGDRIVIGQAYGAGRFSGDLLENFKYTFTPGTKTETLIAGSGLDQRSTTSENIKYTFTPGTKAETQAVTDTGSGSYSPYIPKLFALDAKASTSSTFSSVTVNARDRDRLFIGSTLDQRVANLEKITFNISKTIYDTSTLIDLATVADGITFTDILTRYETITMGTGDTAGNRYSGSSLENVSFYITKIAKLDDGTNSSIETLYTSDIFSITKFLDLKVGVFGAVADQGDINNIITNGGLVRSTSYVDIDYIAEDFVGQSSVITY